jgi:cell division septation protein DedD
MDEQVTWKGQSFTLLVFGGIVFLCSVFFVLGMLVGRGQGKSAAEAATVSEAAKAAALDVREDTKSSIAPYQGITTGALTSKETKESKEPAPSAAREPEPVKAPPAPDKSDKPAKPAPAKAAPAKPAPAPVKMIYLQVTALEKDSAATKQMEDLKKAGFPAVVMGGEGGKGLYKVQVGPYANSADADAAKRKLEALGYKPIKK